VPGGRGTPAARILSLSLRSLSLYFLSYSARTHETYCGCLRCRHCMYSAIISWRSLNRDCAAQLRGSVCTNFTPQRSSFTTAASGLVLPTLLFRRCSFRISADTPSILTEYSHTFPHLFQENAKILPQLSHDHFLPNILELIVHNSSYYSPLYNPDMESIVEQPFLKKL
jgi:hypothetical protein